MKLKFKKKDITWISINPVSSEDGKYETLITLFNLDKKEVHQEEFNETGIIKTMKRLNRFINNLGD